MSRKMIWNKYTRVLEYGEKIILANRYNGQWFKVSRECYDILKLVISKAMTDDELITALEEQDDKEYFQKLLKILYDSKFIVENQLEYIEERSIDIAITNRCNLCCTHCCVNSDSLKQRDILNTEDLKEIIRKVVSCNPKSICLTGGEPMTRLDFQELLTYLRQLYSGEIRLMTNATLIDEYQAKMIAELVSVIDISIDGIDEETCSKIRGKNVFSKVINSIKMLHKYNFNNISLSMVLTRENYFLRKEFTELNTKLGTRAVIRAFSPIGRGKENASILKPGEQEKEIEEKKYSNRKVDDFHVCSCGALSKELYINYKGDIYPCGLLERDKYILGNILNLNDFKDYLNYEKYCNSEGYKNWLKLQPENHKFCKTCNVNLFCWNCLHYLDLLEDNRKYFEEECLEIKNYLKTIIWEED